jgi:hypothetical protein
LKSVRALMKPPMAVAIISLSFTLCITVFGQGVPQYKVDPSWPKELPNNWIMGQVGGMAVDSQDHIWVFQRPGSNTPDEIALEQKPPTSGCCKAAPAVMEFDKQGNLLKSWGGPGFVKGWPGTEHGIYVDKSGNVWLSGNNAQTKDVAEDRTILKFNSDGKLLMQIGHPANARDNNQVTEYLGRVASMEVDDAAHEIYVADGYGNRRIVVYDSETGAFKRGWGAYGIPLSQIDNSDLPPYSAGQAPAKQFLGPVHCVHVSKDGLVYVCDRTGDRIQVFTKQGKFLKEFIVSPNTTAVGAVWQLTFSHDPQQKYLLVADGSDNVIWILNREDGKVAGSFGHAGRNAGQFHWVHQLVQDSEGNLYTGEVDTGKRVQKFILQK